MDVLTYVLAAPGTQVVAFLVGWSMSVVVGGLTVVALRS